MSPFFFELRFYLKAMECLACIVAFIYWAKLKPLYWRSFPVYLLIITCCECIGWYCTKYGIKGTRAMYNYFVIPLEFLYFHFLFYLNVLPVLRKTVVVASLLYIATLVVEYSKLINVKWVWLSFSYSVGSLSILIMCIMYLMQLSTRDNVLRLKTNIFFWVNIGLLLFYVGTFPYYATSNYLYKSNESVFNFLSWVAVILNYSMYSFFIIGILCYNPKR